MDYSSVKQNRRKRGSEREVIHGAGPVDTDLFLPPRHSFPGASFGAGSGCFQDSSAGAVHSLA